MTTLPEGYGSAAPTEEGAAVYAKKTRRKRAARVLRGKKTGSYRAFVKDFLSKNKGKTIMDAAKAYKAQKA